MAASGAGAVAKTAIGVAGRLRRQSVAAPLRPRWVARPCRGAAAFWAGRGKFHNSKLWWPIHMPQLRRGRPGPWTCDVWLQLSYRVNGFQLATSAYGQAIGVPRRVRKPRRLASKPGFEGTGYPRKFRRHQSKLPWQRLGDHVAGYARDVG